MLLGSPMLGPVCLALLAALAVLVLPGLPLLLALRLRGVAAAAFLPALSLAVVTLAAEASHLVGLRWGPMPVAALALAMGAGAHLLSRLLRARAGRHLRCAPFAPPRRLGRDLGGAAALRAAAAPVLGLAAGATAIVLSARVVMGSVDAVSQTWDGIFHLSAVREVLRHGDASAFAVGSMVLGDGERGYYPSLWHQAASLVVEMGGQQIPLSSNLLMLLVGAVVWPLGVMALVRTATSARAFGVGAAGALSGAFTAFPIALMSFGLVLPALLSTALLPLVVLLGARVLGLAPEGPARISPAQTAALVPLTGVAVIGAHPQGYFGAAVLLLPLALWALARGIIARIARNRRSAPREGSYAAPSRAGAGRLLPPVLAPAAGAAVVLASILLIWPRLRPARSSSLWQAETDGWTALGKAVGGAGSWSSPYPAMSALLIVTALAVLLLTRSGWLVAAWGAAAWLYVIAAAGADPDLRYLITGPWYTDPVRIAALPQVVSVAIIAVGADALVQRTARALNLVRTALTPLAAAAIVVVLATLPATGAPAAKARADYAGQWQIPTVLSEDERSVLQMVPHLVPEGGVIAATPWNGSSLAYALSDRDVTSTFMTSTLGPDQALIATRLQDLADDPEVCAAAERLGVTHALDFGSDRLGGEGIPAGPSALADGPAARTVVRIGDASLLSLEPCRLPDGSMSG